MHWLLYKLSLTASYLGCYCICFEGCSEAPRKEKLGDEIVTWVRKPQWSLRTVYHSHNGIIDGKRGYCPESATAIPSFTSQTKIILVIVAILTMSRILRSPSSQGTKAKVSATWTGSSWTHGPFFSSPNPVALGIYARESLVPTSCAGTEHKGLHKDWFPGW